MLEQLGRDADLQCNMHQSSTLQQALVNKDPWQRRRGRALLVRNTTPPKGGAIGKLTRGSDDSQRCTHEDALCPLELPVIALGLEPSPETNPATMVRLDPGSQPEGVSLFHRQVHAMSHSMPAGRVSPGSQKSCHPLTGKRVTCPTACMQGGQSMQPEAVPPC